MTTTATAAETKFLHNNGVSTSSRAFDQLGAEPESVTKTIADLRKVRDYLESRQGNDLFQEIMAAKQVNGSWDMGRHKKTRS